MPNLFVYYRTSDKGNPKVKLPNGDKFFCMQNAIKEFGGENIHVIADNCGDYTITFIKKLQTEAGGGITFEETALGNSGSFIFIITVRLNQIEFQLVRILLFDILVDRALE